jgi:hypothetical protein
MMNFRTLRAGLLVTAFALAGCGGGGGGGVVSTPPPPVTPPSTPAGIIPGATTSQQFTVVGTTQGDSFPGGGPTQDDSDQTKVRYDATTKTYEVQLPGREWQAVTYNQTLEAGDEYVGTVAPLLASGNYQYSRFLSWNDGADSALNAVGMATPASGVPVTGSANYAGQLLGQTTEYHADVGYHQVDGSIALSFDFGSGNLSGSISPDFHQGYDLGSIDFTNTVYATGSTTFSGKFDTGAAGLNSFSGLFTGPTAQERIGQFQLPYISPLDGHAYQADGAFIGKK